MDSQDQVRSRDLIFDVCGHLLTLLRLLMALGAVETANQVFGLLEIMASTLGMFTSLIYTFAVILLAGVLITTTDRIFEARLRQLQSFVSRSLPIGQTVQNGYRHVSGKLGLREKENRSSKFSVIFLLTVYFSVFVVIRIYDGFSGNVVQIFPMLFFALIVGFSAMILMLVGASVVAGRKATRQQNATPES